MSQSQTRSIGNVSAQELEKAIASFIEELGALVAPENGVRPLFPNFKLNRELSEKIEKMIAKQSAPAEEFDPQGLRELLEDVTRHFKNSKAAFARGALLNDIRNDIERMVAGGCSEDIIAPVKLAVGDYASFVGKQPFDLAVASVLFWKAADSVNFAFDAFEEQKQKRLEEEAKRRKQVGSVFADKLRRFGILSK